MSNQSTTKTVEKQNRAAHFNYHLSKLQEPYKNDIAKLIKRCMQHGDTITEIAQILSEGNYPISRQRLGEIVGVKWTAYYF